jgi:dUTP pyrophosphatase
MSIRCQAKLSSKCQNKDLVVGATESEPMGQFIVCLACLAESTKTKLVYCDFTVLREIDTPAKAYLLGWIAARPRALTRESIEVGGTYEDSGCLQKLRTVLNSNLPLVACMEAGGRFSFTLEASDLINDVYRHLQIDEEKNEIHLPALDAPLLWVFLRGLFDGCGHVSPTWTGEPGCIFYFYVRGRTRHAGKFAQEILDFCKIPSACVTSDQLRFEGTNAVDLVGRLYADCGDYRLERNYKEYLAWWAGAPPATTRGYGVPTCAIFKADAAAVMPTKAKASDVGYDLTVIRKEKELLEGVGFSTGGDDNCEYVGEVTRFDTGLRLRVPHGYYGEIVPRSSLSKSGWMLANSIGIIDPSYRGNLLVALVKANALAPDIELPFKCCQLVFRRQEHMMMVETDESLDATARADGSFGSSDSQ